MIKAVSRFVAKLYLGSTTLGVSRRWVTRVFEVSRVLSFFVL